MRRVLSLAGALLIAVYGCDPPAPRADARAGDAGVDARETATDASDDEETSLVVTPSSVLCSRGGTVSFVATAYSRSGRARDVTREARWSSSYPTVATITADGVALGLQYGATSITAALGALRSNVAHLDVEGPMLRSIVLDPEVITTGPDDPDAHEIHARGTFSDGSTRGLNGDGDLTWSSSNTQVATVDSLGRVRSGGAPGNAIITARMFGASADAVVTACDDCGPSSLILTLDPSTAALAVGAPQRFTVTATFAGGRTADFTSMATFAVDNANATLGTGDDANLVTARAAGTVVLTATVGAWHTTAEITIGP